MSINHPYDPDFDPLQTAPATSAIGQVAKDNLSLSQAIGQLSPKTAFWLGLFAAVIFVAIVGFIFLLPLGIRAIRS